MIVPQNVINTVRNIAIDDSSADATRRVVRVTAIIPTRHCNCRAISSRSSPLVQPVCNPPPSSAGVQVWNVVEGWACSKAGWRAPLPWTTTGGGRIPRRGCFDSARVPSWFHTPGHYVEDERNFLPFLPGSLLIFFSAFLLFFLPLTIPVTRIDDASRRRSVLADLRVSSGPSATATLREKVPTRHLDVTGSREWLDDRLGGCGQASEGSSSYDRNRKRVCRIVMIAADPPRLVAAGPRQVDLSSIRWKISLLQREKLNYPFI